MKKSWSILLILLVLFVILCNAAVAYTELEAYDEKCYKDGSFSFMAKNSKLEPLATDTINVIYRHEDTRKFSPVNGVWDMKEMYLSANEQDKESARYVSPRGLLKEEGEYFVYLEYKGCKETRCLETIHLKSCPGLIPDCERRDAEATACFHRGRDLYIRFELADTRFINEIDPKRDFAYYLYSNMGSVEGEVRPFGIELEEIAENKYQATMPLREGEIVSQVAVTNKMCESDSVQYFHTINCSYYKPLKDKEDKGQEDEIDGITETEEGMRIRKIEKDESEEPTMKEAEDEFEELEEFEKGLEPKEIDEGSDAVGSEEEEPSKIPIHFMLVILIVVLGVAYMIASGMGEGSKEKKKAKKADSDNKGKKESNAKKEDKGKKKQEEERIATLK